MKKCAAKGDIASARLIADQITRYRQVSLRNFDASVEIATRAQVMVSNHKINRAEVEAIKGIKYANAEEDLETTRRREQKYAIRMEYHQELEDISKLSLEFQFY